jgi:hypothetical protein
MEEATEEAPLSLAQRLERSARRSLAASSSRREEAALLLQQAASLYELLLAELAEPPELPDPLVRRCLRLQREACLRRLEQLRRRPAMSERQRSSDSGTEKLRQAVFDQIDEQDSLLAQLEPMSAQKVLKNQETVAAIRACNRELKKLFKSLLQEVEAKDRLIQELLSRLDAADPTPKPSPKPSPIPTFQPSATGLTQPLEFEPLQLPDSTAT